MKQKIVLNYSFACTLQSLFRAISTQEGLSVWFADNVDINGNIYTFYWNKLPSSAVMISKKENDHIKFHWVDDPSAVFEFRLEKSDLIFQNYLIITDLVENQDAKEVENLWNNQIEKLKRVIGCPKN